MPLDLILSTLVTGIPALVLYLFGKTQGRKHRKPRPCSCGHPYSGHNKQGHCQAQIKRPYYANWGTRNGYEWVRCPCVQNDAEIPPDSHPMLKRLDNIIEKIEDEDRERIRRRAERRAGINDT